MKTFNSETKTWSGPKVVRSDETVPFRELVLQSLQVHPEKVCQISDDEGTQLTFSQMEELSIRVAQNLSLFRVRGGDVVSVLLKNSTFAAPITFGCFLLGATVNPFFCKPDTDISWIKKVLNMSRPKVIIMEEFLESYGVIQILQELELDSKIFLVEDPGKLLGANVFNVRELLKTTGTEKDFK